MGVQVTDQEGVDNITKMMLRLDGSEVYSLDSLEASGRQEL